MSDLWLIRNDKNEISGPFSKDNIISMIHDNKLTKKDAICMSNSDWLNLSNFEGVSKTLSIKIPDSWTKDSSSEKTSIIETNEELTQEILVNNDNKSNRFYKTFKKLKRKLEKMDNSNVIAFLIIIVIIFIVVKTLKILIYS